MDTKNPDAITEMANPVVPPASGEALHVGEDDLPFVDLGDGTRIQLRGEGEILGTRQSGSPGFKLADLAVHEPEAFGAIVSRARAALACRARRIVISSAQVTSSPARATSSPPSSPTAAATGAQASCSRRASRPLPTITIS